MSPNNKINQESIRQHYNKVAQKFYGQPRDYSDRMIERIKIPPNMCVLDIGCGAGNFTFEIEQRYSPKKIIGLDFSENLINIAKHIQKKKGIKAIEFVHGDATSLEFEDNLFDVVLSNMVLHLMNNQRRVLSEAYRVLKPACSAVFCFQGQRPIAPEYFKLVIDSYRQVLPDRDFPHIFNIIQLTDLDAWMKEMNIESFRVDWQSRTLNADRKKFDYYINWFDLVSGFWRADLSASEVEAVESLLKEKIDEHFSVNQLFKFSWNNIILMFTKNALLKDT